MNNDRNDNDNTISNGLAGEQGPPWLLRMLMAGLLQRRCSNSRADYHDRPTPPDDFPGSVSCAAAGDEDDEPGLLLARLLVSLPALLQVLHHQPPICSFSAAQCHFCCTSPSPWRDVGSVRVVSRAAITFRLTAWCKLVRWQPDKV